MHWATQMAKDIIEARPNNKLYTCASGISPSGRVHIGNFREIITTFFVAKELKNLGKDVRFIFSWDDFDRFRKVPSNISKEFEKYLGLPYSKIPSPEEGYLSYADYFETLFKNELEKLDIQTEFVYQTQNYNNKKYNSQIKYALNKRLEIFDILQEFKTQSFTKQQRLNYYPINVYCNHCGKDTTTITHYDSDQETIDYKCECGHSEQLDLNSATNIKLHWKIDWPMRWKYEKVDFEPGGRDHASETGSYAVSKLISEKIFDYPAPMFLGYDFVTIKGSNSKIASSAGNVITIDDVLNVYDKYQIKWFFAKYKPGSEFSIALDDDVIRYYSEFDRFVDAYFDGRLEGQTLADNIRLTDVTKDYLDNVGFNHLVSFLPMVNYDENLLQELLEKEDVNCNTENYKKRKQRATFWLKNYGQNYGINILDEFNQDYYDSLEKEDKEMLQQTSTLVLNNKFESTTQLQNALYSIPINEDDDPKVKKKKQRTFFKHIYHMLTGKKKGPKLGLFILALPDEKLRKLLP